MKQNLPSKSNGSEEISAETYRKIGEVAIAFLQERRAGGRGDMETWVNQFVENERLIAREALETAELLLDITVDVKKPK